jgi:hypothetical protein
MGTFLMHVYLVSWNEHIHIQVPDVVDIVAVLRMAAVALHMLDSDTAPEGQVGCMLGCTAVVLPVDHMGQVDRMEIAMWAVREVFAAGRVTRCRRDLEVVENLDMEGCCPDMAGMADSRETW